MLRTQRSEWSTVQSVGPGSIFVRDCDAQGRCREAQIPASNVLAFVIGAAFAAGITAAILTSR